MKTQGAFQRRVEDYEAYPDPVEVTGPILDEWFSHCEIVVMRAAEWDCMPAWHQAPRRFAEAFYYWVAHGRGWYRLHGEPIPRRLGGNDLLLIPGQVLHEVWADGALKVFAAHFSVRVYGAVDLLGLLGATGRFPAPDGAPYARVSAVLARECALQAPGWRGATASALRELVLYVARHQGGRLTHGPTELCQRDLIRMQPVMELVEDRLGEASLRVADLASSLSVSEVLLRQLFARSLNMSPVAFLRRRRIDRACALLRESDMPVKAIAQACGFRDLPFFYRTFRRLMGVTPGAYRHAEEV